MTIILDGTAGITTPAINSSGDLELPGGTANGVLYLNGSNVATSGSALVFDGTNLGLGVTPSAWNSALRALQFGMGSLYGNPSGANDFTLTANSYLDSTAAFKYVANGFASEYRQSDGKHIWKTAGSGTAGNTISFTQAMTLDADRRLQLNTTTFVGNEQFIIGFNSSGSVTQALNTRDANASANNNSHIVLRRSDDTYLGTLGRAGTDTAMFVDGNSYLSLRTGGTERARIDSSGNVLLNNTTSLIGANTSDGSDNKSVMINGGGSTSDLRGAYVWAKGNEHSDAGKLQLNAGNVSGAPIVFHTSGTERARIDASGNLGVGTTTVNEKLEIYKGISYNADPALYFRIGANDSAVDNNAAYTWRTGITGSASGYSYVFQTLARTQSTWTERLRIKSEGLNIGSIELYNSSTASLTSSAVSFYTNSSGLITTGTYLLTVYLNGGGWYSETWCGIMQWYSGSTNSSNATNIYMTGFGHAPNGRVLAARVLRTAGNTNTHALQLWDSSGAGSSSHTITIRVRKLADD